VLIQNGTRLRTAHAVGSIQNGGRLRSNSTILYAGTRLRFGTTTEISAGQRFTTESQAAIVNHLYNYLPNLTDWSPSTYTPAYSGNAGDVDTPFTDLEVYISFKVVSTPTTTVSNTTTPTYTTPPTGATTTTITTIGGVTTTTTTTGGQLVSKTTTSSYASGGASTLEMGPYLKTIDISMPLGGKYSFSATFAQHSGSLSSDGIPSPTDPNSMLWDFPSDLNPYFYGTGAFNNAIVHHKFDLSRQIFITLTFGKYGQYQKWTSPPFAPGAPKFDGFELNWSGEDISVLLEQEYQVMDDITARTTPLTNYLTNTGGRKAVATINNIAKNYGLDKILSPQFPDFDIRQLRRKGRPIDWIDKIAKVYQAQRHWENGKLVFKTTPNPKDVSAKYTISSAMITEGSLSLEFNDSWKNDFTIARVQDNGGFYGKQQCTGGHCIGRTMSITFDEPLTNVNLVLSTTGPAYLTDFVYFNGNTIVGGGAGQSTTYYGPPATSVKGTFQLRQQANTVGGYTSAVGDSQSTPYATDYAYSVYVKGGTIASTTFTDHYSFHIQDNVSIGEFGLRLEHDSIEDEIIPTALVAQAYLKAVLNYNIRRIWKQTLSTVFINPLIFPGDCIRTADFLTNTDTLTVNWIVEKSNLMMSEGGHWTQKLEMSRGVKA
jgi:hypothetical protein